MYVFYTSRMDIASIEPYYNGTKLLGIGYTKIVLTKNPKKVIPLKSLSFK